MNDDSEVSEVSKLVLAFKRRTSRLVMASAICSGVMLALLLLMVTGEAFYQSPASSFFIGCAYMYAKVGVAACHVAICSRPPSRLSHNATQASSGILGRLSGRKVAPSSEARSESATTRQQADM